MFVHRNIIFFSKFIHQPSFLLITLSQNASNLNENMFFFR